MTDSDETEGILMLKVLRSCAVLTMAIVICFGCATKYVDLNVSVHDRNTSEPIEDVVVIARYIAPKLKPQPPGVGGRTDQTGHVMLQIKQRDLPLSVEINAPDHSRFQIPVSIEDLIASQELYAIDDHLYPRRTLDVRLEAVVDSPRE